MKFLKTLLAFIGAAGIILSIAATGGFLDLNKLPTQTAYTTNYVVLVTTTTNGVSRLVSVSDLLSLGSGTTTNLNVLIAGSKTNQMQFTNGFLKAVIAQ